MKVPKKLIIAMIDRERKLNDTAIRLEKADVSVQGCDPNVDIIWQAAGVDPESICDLDDPIYSGFDAGHSAGQIFANMIDKIAEVAG